MNQFFLTKQSSFKTKPEAEKAINAELFKNENYFIYVFKKSERLVSALYLVTNFLADNEPARQEIRSLGLELLSYAVKLGGEKRSFKLTIVKSAGRVLLTINSLLEICCRAGMISEMNFAILHAEFDNLLEIVLSLEQAVQTADEVALSEQFFAVFDGRSAARPQPAPKVPASESAAAHAAEGGGRGTPPERQQKDILGGREGVGGSHRQKRHAGTVNDKKEIRKNVILSLLKRKESVTIKEVAALIHDCSEKTIQRELQGLVDENVLKKEGERRWTRYFMAP